MKIIKTSLLIVLLLISMISVAQTQFIANRGASFLAPENTVASAKLAWELGADAVKADIHLSMDNRIMVIHDKTTSRTCLGKNFTIEKSPSVILRDLDAGLYKGPEFKGEKIPYLDDLIKLIPENKKLVIEIKCKKEVILHLEKLVDKCGKIDQLVFIAFNLKTIIETKEAFPNNECYWLSDSKGAVKKNIEKVKEAKLDGINLSHKIIDQEIMDLAKENDLQVLTWTVDDSLVAKKLIDLGVTAITTNRPKWLKDELGL